jgi:4-coumarate--CoA ligase
VPRAHTSPLRSGMRIYVMKRFELVSWLRNVQSFRITETNMVGSHFLPRFLFIFPH